MVSKTMKASRKQEKGVAADNNGRVNPGSGNGWRHKNDVRSATTSFECKTTSKDQYSLRLDELQIAGTHAAADGKDMAFVIDIAGRRYYTVESLLWQQISDGWPTNDFAFFLHETSHKSTLLKRAYLDVQETRALANEQNPIWVNVIQGSRYITIRDYTWHMLRGD